MVQVSYRLPCALAASLQLPGQQMQIEPTFLVLGGRPESSQFSSVTLGACTPILNLSGWLAFVLLLRNPQISPFSLQNCWGHTWLSQVRTKLWASKRLKRLSEQRSGPLHRTDSATPEEGCSIHRKCNLCRSTVGDNQPGSQWHSASQSQYAWFLV